MQPRPAPGLCMDTLLPPSTGNASPASASRPGKPERPWYLRVSARPGLQGKLTVCFMALLLGALGGSCSLFVDESRKVLDHVAGEQALTITNALGMASQTPLENGDRPELTRIGTDLLKNRSIVAVAFFDTNGKLLSVACKDPEGSKAG